MERISVLSKPYIWADVSKIIAGLTQDPTGLTVEMAIKPSGTDPESGDWKTASWGPPNTTVSPPIYSCKLLYGPGSNNGVLTADVTYDVWVRVTDGAEVPAMTAGQIRAY